MRQCATSGCNCGASATVFCAGCRRLFCDTCSTLDDCGGNKKALRRGRGPSKRVLTNIANSTLKLVCSQGHELVLSCVPAAQKAMVISACRCDHEGCGGSLREVA